MRTSALYVKNAEFKLKINTMKRKMTLLLIAMLSITTVCSAQSQNDRWKNKYINLGFVNTTMSQHEAPDLLSNYGISFSTGRTFYLHQRPMKRVVRLGMDVTWIDLNYTNYQIEYVTDSDVSNFNYHHGEVSMQVGPSIVIAPTKKMNIQAYLRYAPSISLFYDNETYLANYANFFVGGVSVSYGMVGLGAESRMGCCKYQNMIQNANAGIIPIDEVVHNGCRMYLTFKF